MSEFKRAKPGEALAHFRSQLYVVTPECKIWPFAVSNGYGQITFLEPRRQAFHVHRLACLAWHGPPPRGAHAAHGPCHQKLCWNGAHTTWKTPAENNADKLRDGTHQGGERNGRAVLTAEVVGEIRARYLVAPASHREIAALYGVNRSTISNLLRGTTWPDHGTTTRLRSA